MPATAHATRPCMGIVGLPHVEAGGECAICGEQLHTLEPEPVPRRQPPRRLKTYSACEHCGKPLRHGQQRFCSLAHRYGHY